MFYDSTGEVLLRDGSQPSWMPVRIVFTKSFLHFLLILSQGPLLLLRGPVITMNLFR